MVHHACFVIGSDTHWFRLNGEGALIHVIHRFEEPPIYMKWKANEPISTFSMIPKDGKFHILAKTPSGIYYLKRSHKTNELQEMCVAPYAKTDHPYLFFDQSTPYLCYILYKEEGCHLVVKTYKEGVWLESAITLPGDDTSQRIRIKDIEFAAAKPGQMYSLFLYRNDRQDHILALLQYDLASGERNVYRIFAAKDSSQSWRIALGIDPLGNPHISWTIKNGENVTYYYTNVHHAEKSRMPLFLSYGQEPQALYFLYIQDVIVLMFASGGKRMQWIRSTDGGDTWSQVSDIGFQPDSGLRFVQGVKEHHGLTVPAIVLGTGSSYFKIFEWTDLFHAYTALKLSIPDGATLQWIRMQLEQPYRNLIRQMETLRRDVTELTIRSHEQESMIHRLQEELGVQIVKDRNLSSNVSYNKNMHLPSSGEDSNGDSN